MVLSDATWVDVYVQLGDVAWCCVVYCVLLRGVLRDVGWCAACPYVVLCSPA